MPSPLAQLALQVLEVQQAHRPERTQIGESPLKYLIQDISQLRKPIGIISIETPL